VTPLVAALLVLCGLVALGLGRLGGEAVARARAQTAADAGALAGAAAGEAEGRTAVEANGARMLTYEQAGDDTRVGAAVGTSRAHARARRSGGAPPGHPWPSGVEAGLRAALARAEQLQGGPVTIVGVQDRGLSVEVDAAGVARLAAVAPGAGLCRADPAGAPGRFTLCPPGGALPP
jgi:hypothetical protein